MHGQPSDFRFDEDLPDTPVTVIGLGEMGIATLNYLHNQAVKDIVGIVLGINPDSLRASVILNKLFLLVDESGDLTNQDQLIDLVHQHPSCLTVVVADLAETEYGQLTLLLVQLICQRVQSKVVTVVLLLYYEMAMSIDTLLATLHQYGNELLAVVRPQDEPTSNRTDSLIRTPPPVERLADISRMISVMALSEQCVNDFSDIPKFFRPGGRININEGRAGGSNRADDALAAVLNQMQTQRLDLLKATRQLTTVFYSQDYELRMAEMRIIAEGLTSQLSAEVALVKTMAASDESLHDRLKILVLTWMPNDSTRY